MSEDNRKWYKKKRFLIPIISFAAFIVLIIILGIIGLIGLSQIPEEEWDNIIEESLEEPIDDPELQNDDPFVDEEADTEDEVDYLLIAQQDLFNGWLEMIQDYEEPALIAMENYNSSLGTNDNTQIYQAAKSARDATEKTWRDFSNLTVNVESFDKETGELIENLIHEDLAMHYYSQRNAFKKAMDYIDTLKQSDLDEMEQEFQMAEQYQMNAINKIITIEEKLGLGE